jgi:hypothetical protein
MLKFDLKSKLELLKHIRHEIKRKRFILDENRENFGFDDMSQLSKVKNTSEVKGYPFVASKLESKLLKGLKIGLKVVPIETKFDKHEHPTYLEFIALKELTDNIVCKNISPHIAYYLGNQKVLNKSKALKFLNLKRLEVEEQIQRYSNMLISEYIEGNSLDTWIYNIYENNNKIDDKHWKIIVFQLIYTIAIIQYYYNMMHNDFHYGNILMDTSIEKIKGQYFVYKIDGETYYIPNIGCIPKLWDFEFAMTFSDKIPDFYPNKFIIGECEYNRQTHKTTEPVLKDDDNSDDFNVPYNYNKVYDLHYFLTSLLELYISQELFDWILEIYPEEVIPHEEDSSTSTNSTSTLSVISNIKSLSINSKTSQDIKKNNNINDSDSNYDNDSISNSNSDNNSDSDSNSESNSDSDSDSDSNSDGGSNSDGDSNSDSSMYNRYLSEGRLKNGVEKEFNLPTPLSILKHSFFSEFKHKPLDFDEEKSIYFKSGF